MALSSLILATAGHVDHGKSALVKALTGTDPDRLPEEQSRGITIDLGFAHLEIGRPGSEERFSLGIVDVPGHEDFVKNMVAGVGSIDLALLVVAADDGWMPQSEEHLQILTYLGVERAVVAVTKMDLVEGREEEVLQAVRGHLQDSPLAEAPIVPTSVVTGRGLDTLKQALLDVAERAPAPLDLGKPRLPVDRVFSLRGIGTVVTGTLSGGSLRRGQAVKVQPAGSATRIRTLQNFNAAVEVSHPGSRTALNLPDLEAAYQTAQGVPVVQRGDVITLPELGVASDVADVLLEKSGRNPARAGADRPLRDGMVVRVHHGSGNTPARLLLLGDQEVEPGGKMPGQLRFETPVFFFAGDRFILRDWSEQATLGGGVVLDADAGRKRFRKPAQRRLLEARAAAPGDVGVFVQTELARDGIRRISSLLVKSRFSAAAISNAVSQSTRRTLFVAGDWAADGAWWRSLRERAQAAIDEEHKARPQHVGLPITQLRSLLASALPEAEMFDILLGDLCREGFKQVGTAIKRGTHQPALPPNLQASGRRIRDALAAKPFEPPSKKELAHDALGQQALRFLRETGEVVELSDELVLQRDAFHQMKEVVAEFIRAHGPSTVSDLRQKLGTTRRVIMPLLERLDRDGVTLREGDRRTLRQR